MEGIEDLIKDAPPVPLPGNPFTLGMFERAVKSLMSISAPCDPEPSLREITEAVTNVKKVMGKKCFLQTPESILEGTFQPSDWLGVNFVYYERRKPLARLYSQEWLKLEKENLYTFSTQRHESGDYLKGMDSLEARYILWRAGVRRPKK